MNLLICGQDVDGKTCDEPATYYIAKNVLGAKAHFLCTRHARWAVLETGLPVIQIPDEAARG